MNIFFYLLVTLTSRVTILELWVFIPLSDPLTIFEFNNIGWALFWWKQLRLDGVEWWSRALSDYELAFIDDL